MPPDALLRPHDSTAERMTLRSFILGLVVVVCTNVWAIYSEYYMHSSLLQAGIIQMSLFISFFLVVAFVNVGWKGIALAVGQWRAKGAGLSSAELLVIFIMGFAGSAAGGAPWLVALLAAPYYFASTENEWDKYFHNYLPRWLVPANDGKAMDWFFEGLPANQHIQWAVWARPLFWWFTFILAGLCTSVCLVSLFRKQWVEKEKLSFPLMEVPVLMSEQGPPGTIFPAFMRKRLFWVGFALALASPMWNMASYFYPDFPSINIINPYWLSFRRYWPPLYEKINFFVIGFAFFCSTEILFSIWFFHLLAMFQIYVYTRTGFQPGPASEFSNPYSLVMLQGTGGYLFLGVWILWLSRKHLYDVFRKAFLNSKDVDDSGEFLSHRVAVVGFFLGLIYIVGWLYKAEVSPERIGFYILISFIFTIAFAKLLAESGLIYFGGPFSAMQFTEFSLGYTNISPASLTGLTVAQGRGIFDIAQFSHMTKLVDFVRLHKKKLLAVTCIGFLVGTFAAVVYTIYLSYSVGAYNFDHWTFKYGNVGVYSSLKTKIKTPVPTDWAKMQLVGIGAVVTAIITFMRYRFTWWHIHPIGFTVAMIWPVRVGALSFFIVWCIKVICLKLGGVQFVKKAQPFFIGILCGFAMSVLISFIVDVKWFPLEGHMLYQW